MPQNPSRLRIVETPEELRRAPVDAAELREGAVLVRAAALEAPDTLPAVRQAVPWMRLWRDHPSWAGGYWRCVVDAEDDTPVYTAYRPRTLRFHTDMSRYLVPPEFTVIRCVTPDSAGGENLLLHIDDVFARLRELGRDDIIRFLTARRTLSMEARHLGPWVEGSGLEVDATASTQLAVAADPAAPCRIFDRHGATKGSHLDLSPADERLFDDFLDLCSDATDLAPQVRLESGDVLLFSNWRLLHARLACAGSGRVTEICMGDSAPTTEEPAA
ncbi:TauD/TfdA family dioxygenase [Kitasatospora viridis]|uniref:Alpha-ketoglutarate-dependent taurine dioxygenase n=1 Tax=Kitasatospora viridis TaxID=281105 RepID=A0A561T6C1_9ACTN|nr:TauD/TfdA family dioxygenase [Kitasatospora viridis]TWF82660.1 alpha-ketoglutarate-dependent taurine dioxygenase [Kitasatospora viridis]